MKNVNFDHEWALYCSPHVFTNSQSRIFNHIVLLKQSMDKQTYVLLIEKVRNSRKHVVSTEQLKTPIEKQ